MKFIKRNWQALFCVNISLISLLGYSIECIHNYKFDRVSNVIFLFIHLSLIRIRFIFHLRNFILYLLMLLLSRIRSMFLFSVEQFRMYNYRIISRMHFTYLWNFELQYHIGWAHCMCVIYNYCTYQVSTVFM